MVKIIIREIFYFFSFLLGLFILMEIIWPNIVLVYFNVNYLVVGLFLSGLTLIFLKK